MSVVAYARTFPDSVTFRKLEPNQSTRLRDDEADPPSYCYPPVVYMTYTRPVRGRPLLDVQEEIVQVANNALFNLLLADHKTIFLMYGTTLAEAFTFHEREPTTTCDHEVFGYIRIAGAAFSPVGIRILSEPKRGVYAWSAKQIPRRLKKADT